MKIIKWFLKLIKRNKFWFDLETQGLSPNERYYIGCDPATPGKDKTIIAKIKDGKIEIIN